MEPHISVAEAARMFADVIRARGDTVVERAGVKLCRIGSLPRRMVRDRVRLLRDLQSKEAP